MEMGIIKHNYKLYNINNLYYIYFSIRSNFLFKFFKYYLIIIINYKNRINNLLILFICFY